MSQIVVHFDLKRMRVQAHLVIFLSFAAQPFFDHCGSKNITFEQEGVIFAQAFERFIQRGGQALDCGAFFGWP